MKLEAISRTREIHGTGEQGTLLKGSGCDQELLAPWQGQVQCVYVDPPFLTGEAFTRRQPLGEEGWRKGKPFVELTGYLDKWRPEEYLAFLRRLAESGRALLRDTGVFCLHLDWRGSALGRQALDEVFGEKRFMNEIIWAYESGGRSTRHFSRKHDTLLLYAAGRKPRFDLTRVPISRVGKRKNHMRRTQDDQGRPCRTIRSGGKVYRYYEDAPTYPTDVWTDIPHIQQRDPVRTGWPTQKPQALLSRVLRPVCAPGDLAADLCCGSGTTLATALAEDMRFLGVDSSPAACAVTRKRLQGANYTLELPCAEEGGSLWGEVNAAGIALERFQPARPLPMENPGPWDGVEQWSAGRIRGEAFYPVYSFGRTPQSPALPQSCFLPQGEGELAVEIIDVWGDKHLFAL